MADESKFYATYIIYYFSETSGVEFFFYVINESWVWSGFCHLKCLRFKAIPLQTDFNITTNKYQHFEYKTNKDGYLFRI